jgi:hypothetical protein
MKSDRGMKMSIVDEIVHLNLGDASHAAGAFATSTLRTIEQLLPSNLEATAETGCGKSTILFSNIAASHLVFSFDDRHLGAADSSVLFYENCPLTKLERVEAVFGPTQQTLPRYDRFKTYDCVLIDGPHGYPFPELEYYYLYPHVREGGYLIIDDVHIPTVGRLADFLQEDDMFEIDKLVDTTALFKRTSAPLFDPFGDGWWTQRFNQRRTPINHPFHLHDGTARPPFHNQVGGYDPLIHATANLTQTLQMNGTSADRLASSDCADSPARRLLGLLRRKAGKGPAPRR